MRGWLRYFALNAQVRTGVSGWVLGWALIAVAAAAAAAGFLLVAAFVWLADVFDSLIAGAGRGCGEEVVSGRRKAGGGGRGGGRGLRVGRLGWLARAGPQTHRSSAGEARRVGRGGLEPIDAEAGTNRADQPSACVVSSASARCRSRE